MQKVDKMNVQLNTQTIVASPPKNRVVGIIQSLLAAGQNFHAPFSEKRALLMTVDGLLVLSSLWSAFVLWQLTNNSYFDPDRILARWYLFPAFLASWWVLA